MIDADLDYVRRLILAKAIEGPILELGAGYEGATCRRTAESLGMKCFSTDIHAGEFVDFVADFEKPQDMKVFQGAGPFGAVLILNVLEHTFDPLRVMDNALTLLRPGGALVLLTPSVWPLHNYPIDAWRILPNLYEEYAKRRGLTLPVETFEYPGFGPVSQYRNPDGSYAFPRPTASNTHFWYSKVMHRVLGTFGRSMHQPSHIAVAAVLRTAAPS